MGYFGPGELPVFDANFFDIPKGTREHAALDTLIKVIETADGTSPKPASDEVLFTFRDRLQKIIAQTGLNHAAFSRHVGMDRSTLSQLLSPANDRLYMTMSLRLHMGA